MSLSPANDDAPDPSAPDAAAAPLRAGRAEGLAQRYRSLGGATVLEPLIEPEFPGRLAVVSSFGDFLNWLHANGVATPN